MLIGEIRRKFRVLYSEVEFDYHNTIVGEDVTKINHAVFVKNTIITGKGMITSVDPNNLNKYPKIATLSTKANSIVLNDKFDFPNGKIEIGFRLTKTLIEKWFYTIGIDNLNDFTIHNSNKID